MKKVSERKIVMKVKNLIKEIHDWEIQLPTMNITAENIRVLDATELKKIMNSEAVLDEDQHTIRLMCLTEWHGVVYERWIDPENQWAERQNRLCFMESVVSCFGLSCIIHHSSNWNWYWSNPFGNDRHCISYTFNPWHDCHFQQIKNIHP